MDYYRYHPLLLNAAFLGNLTEEHRRILGFGDKTNYIPLFEREVQHAGFQTVAGVGYDTKLRTEEFVGRVRSKLKNVIRRAGM